MMQRNLPRYIRKHCNVLECKRWNKLNASGAHISRFQPMWLSSDFSMRAKALPSETKGFRLFGAM
jgi:hypothetical protein